MGDKTKIAWADAAIGRFVDRTDDESLAAILEDFELYAESPNPRHKTVGLFASAALTRAYRDKLQREQEAGA